MDTFFLYFESDEAKQSIVTQMMNKNSIQTIAVEFSFFFPKCPSRYTDAVELCRTRFTPITTTAY